MLCNKREPFCSDESFDLINTENEAQTTTMSMEHTAGIAKGKLKLLINIFPFKFFFQHFMIRIKQTFKAYFLTSNLNTEFYQTKKSMEKNGRTDQTNAKKEFSIYNIPFYSWNFGIKQKVQYDMFCACAFSQILYVHLSQK